MNRNQITDLNAQFDNLVEAIRLGQSDLMVATETILNIIHATGSRKDKAIIIHDLAEDTSDPMGFVFERDVQHTHIADWLANAGAQRARNEWKTRRQSYWSDWGAEDFSDARRRIEWLDGFFA